MKIALVCAHYLPDLGYLEVHLARALTALGHSVTVVTTPVVPAYAARYHKGYWPGKAKDGAVEVHRVKAFFTMGQITAARGVGRAVKACAPDLIVVTGPGKYFPKPVYGLGIPVLTLLGDNAHTYHNVSAFRQIRTALLFAIFKAPVYKLALRTENMVMAYTPESFQMAGKYLPASYQKRLAEKRHFTTLGFDPHHFHFDPMIRSQKREELSLDEDVIVVLTATRVVPEKNLERYLVAFRSLPHWYKWIVVGSDGGRYSAHFALEAEKLLGKERFTMLPYCKRPELLRWMNAADLAFYPVTAITVFEALGCGLPCILPDEESLSHVLAHRTLCIGFDPENPDTLSASLSSAPETFIVPHGAQQRAERCRLAAMLFSWQSVAQTVIDFAEHEAGR